MLTTPKEKMIIKDLTTNKQHLKSFRTLSNKSETLSKNYDSDALDKDVYG